MNFRRYTVRGVLAENICVTCKFERGSFCAICSSWSKGNQITCGSMDCVNVAREKSFLEHFGVSNVFSADHFQELRKSTMMAKYGVDHQSKVPEIRARIVNTLLENYGVDNPGKSEIVKEKMRITCQEKYGVDFVFQDKGFLEKAKMSCLERYGVENHSQTEERRKAFGVLSKSPKFRENHSRKMIAKYGHRSPFGLPRFRVNCNSKEALIKRHETMKRNHSFRNSIPEELLYQYLFSKYPGTRRQEPVERWAIDFYIPEIETFVNVNGTYWHGKDKSDLELMFSPNPRDAVILSTKHRDQKRREWFSTRGLRFIELWENEVKDTSKLEEYFK